MFVSEIERLERADNFLKKAKELHGNKFDYTKVEYVNSTTKVTILCKQHGEFQQSPSKHITHTYGCPKCARIGWGKKRKLQENEFMQKVSQLHNGTYSYKNLSIGRQAENISVHCIKHKTDTLQKLHLHLKGHMACKECLREKKQEQAHIQFRKKFIEHFVNKFGKHYDFSKVDYVDNRTAVTIKCHKHNLEFQQAHRNAIRYNTPSCKECKKDFHKNLSL